MTVAGCSWSNPTSTGQSTEITQQVPKPINLTLPKSIHIHPFTGMRSFEESGKDKGLDVRIEAMDSAGDTTKAFGDFRFELYFFRPVAADPKGNKIATWEVSLSDPKKNAVHWDNITRAYKFKLQWNQPYKASDRFVLAAIFTSPFTGRLFNERVIVAGQ